MSFDRDLRRKEQAKYDERFDSMCEEARAWLQEVLGRSVEGDLIDSLRDGSILCEVCNVIIPGSVRGRKSGMPFVQMENIGMFLSFARDKLGIPAHDMFQTVDLYERKNTYQVIQCIHTLSRYAQTKAGLEVRGLGPKMSTSNSRDFTKEQLAEARNTVNTFQYGKHTGSTNVLRSSRRDPAGNIY
ncbi:calponin [Savitreella phatthalungensis]